MRRFIIISLLVLSWVSARAAVEVTLVGDQIPSRYLTGAALLFHQSDSLYLNGRLLARGADYRVDAGPAAFDLTTLEIHAEDTLRLIYTPVPRWLPTSFGRPLPEVTDRTRPGGMPAMPGRFDSRRGRDSDLTIGGAKSFRFSTQTSGGSNFSQSLDLALSGELTPGVTITGAVSDRGYDPAYGTANSRLNELNKISLELESRRVRARIGDVTVTDRFAQAAVPYKRVSGAAITVSDRSWYVEAAAARPKGLFESARFYGADGVQGPYPIGNRSGPIVPGSEQVWLDGQLLQRGTNAAYTMDYPTGTITFNVIYPIDSRRRIEIDYEPQATDYRGELYSGGGGTVIGDSTVVVEVGWLREGDDRDQPLAGELSDSDREILAAAGDDLSAAVRSGIRPDTSGQYVLVPDSLPDSVFAYVPADSGDYTITFSYIGTEQGAYRNAGSGRYEFVGDGNGDYLPLVFLDAPRRADYFTGRMAVRDRSLGQFSLDYRRSESDRNLFSSQDDADNDGNQLAAGWKKSWRRFAAEDYVAVDSRYREATFQSRERLYAADFARAYYLPRDFVPVTDEWQHTAALRLSPVRGMAVEPTAALLTYDDNTESGAGGMRIELTPRERLVLAAAWRSVETDIEDTAATRHGQADTYGGDVSYAFNKAWRLLSDFEHDQRTNDYDGDRRGTRYNRLTAAIERGRDQLAVERYVEDSLTVGWEESVDRTRLEFRSSRQTGPINYSTTLAQQWLSRPGGDERSFLGRLNLTYSNPRKRLTVSSSYLRSDETRNSRGITYLEVERGRGEYSLEDGQYVPDREGNYIQVEEILSDRAHVSRGEKNFYLSKQWSLALVRVNSQIEEELLDEGSRSGWWALPFYADPDQPYQYYRSRHDIDLRLLPLGSAHAINLTAGQGREIRTVSGSNRERRDRSGALTLKQVIAKTFLEETVTLFDSRRDSYYTGGGNFDGYNVNLTWRQLVGSHEMSIGGGYRHATGDGDEVSKQLLVRAATRLAVVSRGELRGTVELYRQDLTGDPASVSYVLTDNRPGDKGAIWSVNLRYGVKKSFRISAGLSGRHSDNRTGRVTAQGEMVAEF